MKAIGKKAPPTGPEILKAMADHAVAVKALVAEQRAAGTYRGRPSKRKHPNRKRLALHHARLRRNTLRSYGETSKREAAEADA